MASLIRTLELSERRSNELMAVGSASAAMASAAGVILAVLGLALRSPERPAALATLAIGVGLLFEGGAIGARFRGALMRDEEDLLTRSDVVGGLTADLAAGAAGVVLGLLALFGVASHALLGTAVIVYGAGILLSCAALVHSTTMMREGVFIPSMGRDAVMLAAGAQLVAGLIALALGSAVLLGAASMDVTLAALLVVAASELASGATVTTGTLRMLQRA